ncbi:MAG: hypothetical protein WA021_02620 [Minisyncoccia bacterium]
MKIAFPPLFGEVSAREIFLPSTPWEFFEILDSLEQHHTYPPGTYDEVNLVTERPPNQRDEEDEPVRNEMIDAIIHFTDSAESVEELEKTFKAHTFVDLGRLQAANVPQKIDTQFHFLITRDASRATTVDEIERLRSLMEGFEYPHFNLDGLEDTKRYLRELMDERLKAIKEGVPVAPMEKDSWDKKINELAQTAKDEREALYSFFDRIKLAASKEDLDSIATDVQARNFVNRGHYGLIKAAITHRNRKLGLE